MDNYKDYNRKLGIRLLIFRGERSRREVADEIGIHMNTLERYENGKAVDLNMRTLEILADYYGITLEDLLRL